jgi:hypothetical protein
MTYIYRLSYFANFRQTPWNIDFAYIVVFRAQIINVRELKEYEKKRKIVSLSHVNSAPRCKISLRYLLATNENNDADDENTDIASFFDALSLCDDVAIRDAETAALVFVAG